MPKRDLNLPELVTRAFTVLKGRVLVFCDCSNMTDRELALTHLIKESEDIADAPVFTMMDNRYVVVDSSITIEKAKSLYENNFRSLEDASDAFTVAKFEQLGWAAQRMGHLMRACDGRAAIQTQPPHKIGIDPKAPHDPQRPPIIG